MFKPFSTALATDPRFANMIIMDSVKSYRQLTFEDHHSHIQMIELPQTTPPLIQNAFDRCRSCFLYAWFAYELMVVAEAQALASLELALKERLGRSMPGEKKVNGLGGRLSAAVTRGLLAPPTVHSGQPDKHFIVKTIRDELAHGSEDIHSPQMALDIIRICAELIAELYPTANE